MVKRNFDYEEKINNLQDKLDELKSLSHNLQFDLKSEFNLIEKRIQNIREDKYKNLSSWEKVLISRHPERPSTADYIKYFCEDWIELHGDRVYGDDRAIIGGIGLFAGIPVTILGHQKGKDTTDNLNRNFGMPHPEGYRKVKRLLLQAEKFKRPVLNLIDTPGAFPGVGAEERGQATAIAEVLMLLSGLKVPVISVVTGEGGSGGALALAVSDRLYMLSNAVFSVASAEACASIIWKDAERAEEMAAALKLTAVDLKELGVIDGIIEEPLEGAHQDAKLTATNISNTLKKTLPELIKMDKDQLLEQRYQKLRNVGIFLQD